MANTFVHNSGLSFGLSLSTGGSAGPSINNGLLQETGSTDFFELEDSSGIILLES